MNKQALIKQRKKRRQKIVELSKTLTPTQIGRRFGISRQRVHQILDFERDQK